jgi:hypothetical protein
MRQSPGAGYIHGLCCKIWALPFFLEKKKFNASGQVFSFLMYWARLEREGTRKTK